jgi:aminoglycoside phosphotransferase (APT) family kinase protein
MKTPLFEDETVIPEVILRYWNLPVTHLSFIPVGDSAYSYRIETQQTPYYLKIVDQRTVVGHRTATQMEFSLPFQHFIAQQRLPGFAAPLPQHTTSKTLYAVHGPLLFALYTFIAGETLADAYPLPHDFIVRIGQVIGALHSVQTPHMLRQRSPQDSLTVAFDDALLANLASLEHISSTENVYLQQLRELVWPRREQIRAFLAHAHEYAQKVQRVERSSVACHGDPWGGNIIPAPDGRLVLLDWESSVIAPPERDAFIYAGYAGGDFAAFDAGYRAFHKEPVRWNPALLAYYAYRLQLRKLSHWLHNLLHEKLDDMQYENDLEMLGFHCLDRFEGVERTAVELSRMLPPA